MTYHSMEQFEKHYFPERWKKDEEKKEIERLGFGTWLARELLRAIREAVKKEVLG